jgi:23S rRNA (guanosine2251-2'-O)-methyltransferase
MRQRPRPHQPRPHQAGKPGWRRNPKHAPRRDAADRVTLYGLHAVEAALANPKRTVARILATENAAQRLGPHLAKRGLTAEAATPRDLDRLLGPEAVHQGVLLEAEELPPVALDEVDATGMLLVLDQVTDPQNVGALLRSAAAFGAAGLVMTERHSPPLHGALAKVASGALDLVPVVLVKNLAQCLAKLGELGFLRVGLAEEGAQALETASLIRPLALVFGAEGKGLRQLTREHCDLICRISTQSALASLNVSNAAAVALHWASRNAR